MEQARNYVCKECSSPVPSGHKFCGACGATVPQSVQDAQEEFFGSLQTPGRARLVLIRGDQGVDGLTYQLEGQAMAGKQEGQILFPEDPWVSNKHAAFYYQDEKLFVRDENSANGVFVRVSGTTPLAVGQHFLCGEQVFRLDSAPADDAGPGADQTYFYSSPKRPMTFAVTQLVEGGRDGMVATSRDDVVRIGREDADMNFPEDIFMSGTHAHVQSQGGSFQLVDDGSRNGTYVRVDGSRELKHGDYVFLGKQLLRVEVTA